MELVENRFDDFRAMTPVADDTALFPGDLNRNERFTLRRECCRRRKTRFVGIDLADDEQAAEVFEQALKKVHLSVEDSSKNSSKIHSTWRVL